MKKLGQVDRIRSRRFAAIDRAQAAGRTARQADEDQEIFDAVARIIGPPGTVYVKEESELGRGFDPESGIAVG